MKINLPEIGDVEVLLTEDQAKKAVAEGKEIFKNTIEKPVNTSDYIYNSNMATDNTPGGFTGNMTDWDSFFPDISLEEIEDLANDSIKQEKKIRAAAIATCSLITMALAEYMKNNSLVDTQNVQNATNGEF